MKTVVTGANGFIGRALCQHMSGLGMEVIPAVRKPSNIPGEYILPLDDAQIWLQAFEGCHSVVHLAGRAHILREQASNPLQAFRDANLHPSLTLARLAAQAGVKRFVYVSSVKVNGEQTAPGQFFSAHDTPAPAGAYAVSKWEAEQSLRQLAQATGMELVIVRPPMVYGPGVKGNFDQLLRLMQTGLPLPLGAVHNQRSMIGLNNLLDLLCIFAQPDASPKAAGEVFLVSDGPAISTTQLLQKMAQAYNQKIRLLPVPPVWLKLAASVIGQRKALDSLLGSLVVNDGAKSLLGWCAPFTMDEQLQRMAHAART